MAMTLLSQLGWKKPVEQDPEAAEELLPAIQEKPTPPPRKQYSLFGWITLNTIATVGIVFTNKSIFSSPTFRNAQVSFAAYHFACTATLLYTLSRPRYGWFEAKRAQASDLLPLVAAQCFNVVLPNLSLAYSSITFYQLARILLTPMVVLINYVAYKSTIPRQAGYALIPVCVGVGVVSYYDSLPQEVGEEGVAVPSTRPIGVVFALSGVLASSLYTIWIKTYHKKLDMNSMQLLFNQTPLGVLMLFYIIPWTDRMPNWDIVPAPTWAMIILSGFWACMINISQFFIINDAGPVSSTVVGHVKTCTIVTLGWVVSGKSIGDKSIYGILLAICGIVSYTVIMLRQPKN